MAIDPAAVYAKAVRTLNHGTRLLPNACLVVDHFHLVADAQALARRALPAESLALGPG